MASFQSPQSTRIAQTLRGYEICGLADISVENLHHSRNYADIVIPTSKGRLRNSISPISVLWPLHALTAYHRLKDLLDANPDIYRNKKLTEIAGVGSFHRTQRAKLRHAIRRLLRRLNPELKEAPPPHLGRVYWYCWMPVRLRCCHDRRWLTHQLLKPLKTDTWLSEESLSRLSSAFDFAANPLEVLRRMAGHSSERTPLEHYIRTIPLMVAVEHDLRHLVQPSGSLQTSKQLELKFRLSV
jgi:hypothetical protein